VALSVSATGSGPFLDDPAAEILRLMGPESDLEPGALSREGLGFSATSRLIRAVGGTLTSDRLPGGELRMGFSVRLTRSR
jgi:hypothetical protein